MNDDHSICLNHSLTPVFLRVINNRIESTLVSDDDQSALLLKLVVLRHKLVIRELNKITAEFKQQFVTFELKRNKRLEEISSSLRNDAKNEVIKLKRAKQAVERYK